MLDKFTVLILSIISTVNSSCLSESEITSGVEAGEFFSNKAEIEALGADSITFHSFTTCTDSDKNMIGT